MDVLKVSAHSSSIATAGALANTIRQQGCAEIQGIGPKAINQAVKAIAIARSYLASSGVDLIAVPTFVDVEVEGQKRTAIRFAVRPRHLLSTVGSGKFSKVEEMDEYDKGDDEDSSPHAEGVGDEETSPDPSTEPAAQPPREGRFIRDFPESPLEKDEFGL